jgi:hypothetical protein
MRGRPPNHRMQATAGKREALGWASGMRPPRLMRSVRRPVKTPMELVSRRATHVPGEGRCQRCRRRHMDFWRCSTNRGTRLLCKWCREKLMDRVFPSSHDALTRAVSGGRYESNRRKF